MITFVLKAKTCSFKATFLLALVSVLLAISTLTVNPVPPAQAQKIFEAVTTAWNTIDSPSEVWPGVELANLAVVIKSNLATSAKSLSVELVLPGVITSLDGTSTATSFKASALSSGESTTLNFPLRISRDAQPGLMLLYAKIRYSTGESTGGALVVEETSVSFQIKVSETPRLRFLASGWGSITNDAPAAPGDESVTLAVSFQNPSRFAVTPTKQVLRLEVPFANTTGGFEALSILTPSKISPGEIFTSKFLLNIRPSARTGSYRLQIETEFLDTWSSRQSQRDAITLQLLGKPELEVRASKDSLTPGRSNTVDLILTNVGSGNLTSFEGNMTMPKGMTVINGDNNVRISKLAAGDSASRRFELLVSEDLASSNLQLALVASYKDSYGNRRTLLRTLGVGVLPAQKANLDVSLENINAVPGATNRINLLVRNVGDLALRDLRIDLSSSNSATLVGNGSSIFASILQPGTVARYAISVFVSSSAEGSLVQISASISYVDAGGSVRSSTKTLGLNVSPSSSEVLELKAGSSTLLPGVTNEVELSAVNIGGSTITDLRLVFSPPSTMTFIGRDSSLFFRQLLAGEVAKARVQIFIASSIASNVLQLPTSISFRDSTGAAQTSNRILGFSTILEQSGLLRVSLEPNSVVINAVNELKLKVQNAGSKNIRDLRVSVSAPSPITIISEQKRIEDISSGAESLTSVRLNIPAESASLGNSIRLQLLFTYVDAQGTSNSESQSIWVAVREWSSPMQVQTSPSILRAGRMNKPSIAIQNTGSSEMKSVEAVLSVPTRRTTIDTSTSTSTAQSNLITIVQGTERWYSESVVTGGKMMISPEVFASLSALDSLEDLVLTLSYFDSNGNWRKETKNIGFSVRGSVILTFESGRTTPSPVSVGRNFTITATILNRGNTPALYAKIQLKPDGAFLSPAGSVYIGDIDPNTPIPFTLQAAAPPATREGTYPVVAELSYEDKYGVPYTDELKMNVNVVRTPAFQSQGGQDFVQRINEQLSLARQFFLISLGVIIAAGLFGIYKIRKS